MKDESGFVHGGILHTAQGKEEVLVNLETKEIISRPIPELTKEERAAIAALPMPGPFIQPHKYVPLSAMWANQHPAFTPHASLYGEDAGGTFITPGHQDYRGTELAKVEDEYNPYSKKMEPRWEHLPLKYFGDEEESYMAEIPNPREEWGTVDSVDEDGNPDHGWFCVFWGRNTEVGDEKPYVICLSGYGSNAAICHGAYKSFATREECAAAAHEIPLANLTPQWLFATGYKLSYCTFGDDDKYPPCVYSHLLSEDGEWD